MDDDREARRHRRLVFIVSGAMDMLIGGVLVLMGLELLPARLGSLRIPPLAAATGAVMLIAGMAVPIYNLTQLGE